MKTTFLAKLQQVRLSKLHLRNPAKPDRTACGRSLNWQHMATPMPEGPWIGPDKCRKCLAALESGRLGFEIGA